LYKCVPLANAFERGWDDDDDLVETGYAPGHSLGDKRGGVVDITRDMGESEGFDIGIWPV